MEEYYKNKIPKWKLLTFKILIIHQAYPSTKAELNPKLFFFFFLLFASKNYLSDAAPW